MRNKIIFAVLGLVLLVVLGGYGWLNGQLSATGAKPVTLEVKPGMSVSQVASKLVDAGIVRSTTAFKLGMKLRGKDVFLRDGIYTFSGKQNVYEVLDTLDSGGKPREIKVTIPEGKRLKDIIQIVADAGLSNTTDLAAAFKNKNLVPEAATDNLEGFFFPATYPFAPEAKASTIAKVLTDRMRKELTPDRVALAKKQGLNVYQWVTLASIVQAEAGNSSEMPIIAGLFLNRMDEGMPLQSDPTIAYGLNKNVNEINRSAGDFATDTPYNSYTRKGLMPTPINNPGADALLAVIYPERLVNGKPALYFVHGNDRKIHVNSDYNSHLQDVAKYYH